VSFDPAKLTEQGREELALALLLLKDFKCEGKFDGQVTMNILKLAKELGVLTQLEKLMTKIPPMRIVPR
jgi:hypothetical protein